MVSGRAKVVLCGPNSATTCSEPLGSTGSLMVNMVTLSTAPGGTMMVPVTVTVGGRFRQITRFIQRTRTLVSMRGGKVHARGRLFSVDSVELAESLTGGFPNLDATIVLDASVYDGPITPTTPTGDSKTTDTTTSSAASGGTGS